MEKLDDVCMQLVAIGEGLKNVDSMTDKKLLVQYPQIEWKKVKGMRDIISHHYFDVDAEAIFDVCTNHIPPLADTLTLSSETFLKIDSYTAMTKSISMCFGIQSNMICHPSLLNLKT